MFEIEIVVLLTDITISSTFAFECLEPAAGFICYLSFVIVEYKLYEIIIAVITPMVICVQNTNE